MPKITVRPVAHTDIPAILEIYTPYVNDTTISFEYVPPTLEDFSKRVTDYSAVYPYLVAEVDGEVKGYAYASRYAARAGYDWAAEVSIYTDKITHGSGMSAKLYNPLLAILKAQGVCNVVSLISVPHPQSVAFHKKFGFEPFGQFDNVGFKNNQWCSLLYMKKQLQTFANPAPIRPITDFTADEIAGFLNNA